MTRGTVSLVFDDGYERVFENVLPLLNAHNIPGVFAIAIDTAQLEKSGNRPIRSWQKWLHITAQGHEIASHTVNHVDLKQLNAAELEKELKESAEKLSASTLVYPGGSHNQHVVTRANHYYTAARTVYKGYEKIPPTNPMRLRTFNWSRDNWSLPKANARVLWAYFTNSWIIETFHMVDDNEKEMLHSVRTDDFKRHLSFITKLPIHVQTIQQVVSSSRRQ